jgi:hypothetical protein
MAVDTSYVDHWMTVMTSAQRHTFFIDKESSLVKALEAEMSLYATHTRTVDTEMDMKDDIKVFGDNSVSLRSDYEFRE